MYSTLFLTSVSFSCCTRWVHKMVRSMAVTNDSWRSGDDCFQHNMAREVTVRSSQCHSVKLLFRLWYYLGHVCRIAVKRWQLLSTQQCVRRECQVFPPPVPGLTVLHNPAFVTVLILPPKPEYCRIDCSLIPCQRLSALMLRSGTKILKNLNNLHRILYIQLECFI